MNTGRGAHNAIKLFYFNRKISFQGIFFANNLQGDIEKQSEQIILTSGFSIRKVGKVNLAVTPFQQAAISFSLAMAQMAETVATWVCYQMLHWKPGLLMYL